MIRNTKFIFINESQPMRVIVLGIMMKEIFVFGTEYNCETNVDKLHNVIMYMTVYKEEHTRR